MKSFEISLHDDVFNELIEQIKKIRLIDDYPISWNEFVENSISSSCTLLELQRSNHSGVSAYADKGTCNFYDNETLSDEGELFNE